MRAVLLTSRLFGRLCLSYVHYRRYTKHATFILQDIFRDYLPFGVVTFKNARNNYMGLFAFCYVNML